MSKRGVVVAMVAAFLAAMLPGVLMAQPAEAADFVEPEFVQSTLEGCKGDTTSYLPNSIVCPDAQYTTGNLGKGWNELDLVPHRLTTSLGNQDTATTTYNLMIAGDNSQQNSVNGIPEGYDFISEPVVNTAKSDASCSVSAGPQLDGPKLAGGNDDSIYRVLTISQKKGSTCVFDWVKRLSITAEDYNGSSLQAYLFQTADFSGGQKTVPIPVSETLPQQLSKTMTATQDSDHVWEIKKTASPVSMTFGNTCDVTKPLSQPVEITIEWKKLDAAPSGNITVQTKITATNPAKRSLGISITDKIYGALPGQNESLIDTNVINGTIAANTSTDFTHTITVPSGTTGLRDEAVATYKDLQFPDVPIDETTKATASATVTSSGVVTNSTAVITDTEDISGNGLTFSVDSVTGASGTFANGYTLGTKTSGPVDWTSATQSSSGSVKFTKTVYAAKGTIENNGKLTDTATLTGSNGFTAKADATTNITVDTKAALTIDKTIPNVLSGNETATFTFVVKNSAGATVATPSITFAAGQTNKTVTVPGLTPDTYKVSENPATGWKNQPDATVDLTGTKCSGTAEFVNETPPASAQVKKVTVPAGFEKDWTFSLYRGQTLIDTETTTGAGYVTFSDSGAAIQLEEGSYSIVETEQSGWKNNGGTGDCTFTVDYPADAGKTFSCTYTNTYQPSVTLEKKGEPLSKIGDKVDYSFKVTNTSKSGATAGAPELTCVVKDETIGFTSDPFKLAAGASTTLYKNDVTIPSANLPGYDDGAGGTAFKNTATVDCTYGAGSVVATATSSHVTNLFEPKVDVEKTGPTYAKVGDEITYKVTITNQSSKDAPNLELVKVEDTKVPNITVPDECKSLAYEASCTIEYKYTVLAGDYPTLNNEVSVLYNPKGFPNEITDKDTHAVTIIKPDFTITKDCLRNNVPAGASVLFGVDVSNTGDVPLNITLTDSIALTSSNTSLAVDSYPATLNFANGEVSFTVPVGQTVSLEIETIASGSEVVNDVTATATLDTKYGMPNYSLEKKASAKCDVISGATRTIGFWRTHLTYTRHILDSHTLTAVAVVPDGPLGVNADGSFKNGYIDLGWKKLYSVQDVMGILWADTAKQYPSGKRNSLCQARVITSKQLVGAILNTGLDNGQAVPNDLIQKTITALAGTNVTLIRSLGSQLDAYNNSGDDVGVIDLDGTKFGSANPREAEAYANKSIANCV